MSKYILDVASNDTLPSPSTADNIEAAQTPGNGVMCALLPRLDLHLEEGNMQIIHLYFA